jgi:hypothetical protein
MTQDDSQRLLFQIIDHVNLISYYRGYLEIAVQLMNNPDDKTLDKTELLVSTFLQQVECHFDEIEYNFKKLERLGYTEIEKS